MQTIPTTDDIKARRTVRFAAGHLAKYEGWTGTLVGYNSLYDTVHVYVDAPGNPESGSKISYGRKDVEFCDKPGESAIVERREVPVPAPVEHRETVLRVAGVERVIRTEVGGKIRSVKQLEAAHTKAVKAAIIELRKANLDGYRRALATLEAESWSPRRDRDIEAMKRTVRRAERGTLISHGTYDVAAVRRPFPPVRYTETVPEYLVEVEPGHYATEEAAEQLSLA
ncbi:hypothetical protein ABTY96_03110 [Streptomyces sp. NPDC096057]|uniref:hypothetical protein n=1 Tax=Streptomyces sp. NPDC096057 TaxID=3155543 RepID=UPI00331D21BC